jgi:hypothetical protein
MWVEKMTGVGDRWGEWLDLKLRGRLGSDQTLTQELGQVPQVVGNWEEN